MIARNIAFILNLDRERKLDITLESEKHVAKVGFVSDAIEGCYIEVDSSAVEQCVNTQKQDAIQLELLSLSSNHCRLNISKPRYVGVRCSSQQLLINTHPTQDIEHDTLVTETSPPASSSGIDMFEFNNSDENAVSVLTHQDKCRTSGCLNFGSKAKKGLCRSCYQSWIDHGLIKEHFDFVSSDDDDESDIGNDNNLLNHTRTKT